MIIILLRIHPVVASRNSREEIALYPCEHRMYVCILLHIKNWLINNCETINRSINSFVCATSHIDQLNVTGFDRIVEMINWLSDRKSMMYLRELFEQITGESQCSARQCWLGDLLESTPSTPQFSRFIFLFIWSQIVITSIFLFAPYNVTHARTLFNVCHELRMSCTLHLHRIECITTHFSIHFIWCVWKLYLWCVSVLSSSDLVTEFYVEFFDTVCVCVYFFSTIRFSIRGWLCTACAITIFCAIRNGSSVLCCTYVVSDCVRSVGDRIEKHTAKPAEHTHNFK